MNKSALACAFVLITVQLQAQTIPSIQTIKTPEASAIDKIIETPVSYATGTPNISIPLYEINIKGVTVPITLTYHSGGIRADEEATWVGLGWSLNYGGQISRSVEGKPDEYSFFNAGSNPSYSDYSIAYYNTLPTVQQDCYEQNRVEQIYAAKNPTMMGDYMPDEFYYSALGHSGRFMYNQEKNQFVLFPHDDVQVSYTSASTMQTWSGENNYYPIASWNLVMPDGTAVTFGQDGTSSSGSYLNGPGAYVTNMWMVKSIQNRFNESINYTYNPISYNIYKLSGQVYSYYNAATTTNIGNYGYNDAQVKSISFAGGTIQFITTTRTDLPIPALSEIDVLNTSGQVIKKINFKYGYFSGNDGDVATETNDNAIANSGALETNRLRLDTLTISNTGVKPENYLFSYYTPSTVPSKNSFNQDLWGFYNGPQNNPTLIPRMFSNQYQYGQRMVDSPYTNAFALHTITYPTGGQTAYVYECNEAAASTIPLYLQQDLQTPGQPGSFVAAYSDLEISCFGRTKSYSPPAPDSVGPSFGERYFWNTFSVPPQGGVAPDGNNWTCQTDYVRNTTPDNSRNCSVLNVEFLLQQLTPSGYTTVKTFWARNCTTNTWVGSDNESISLLNNTLDTIQYRTSVVLWYPVQSYNPIVYAAEPNPADTNYYNQTFFNLSILNPTPPSPVPATLKVGGLRIKAINTYNSDGSLALQRTFSYSPQQPGQLISNPTLWENVDDPTNGTNIKVFSNSVIPLQTNAGSYLGYTNVTEQKVGSSPAASLTTQYTYSFMPPEYDGIYGYWNQGTIDGQEWERSQLLTVHQLKNGVPVETDSFTYYSYSPNLAPTYSDTTTINLNEAYVDEINTNFISYDVLGTAAGAIAQTDFFDVGVLNYSAFPGSGYAFEYWFYDVGQVTLPYEEATCPNTFITPGMYPSLAAMPAYTCVLPYFKRFSGFAKPQSKTVTLYDNNGNSIIKTENYFFDDAPSLYEMTRSYYVNSVGDTMQTRMQFPTDFSSTVPYDSMVNRNMLTYPVALTKTNDSKFLESETTNYQFFTNGIIAPSTVQTIVGSNPADTRFQYNNYDSIGNILTESKAGDKPVSMIYDYTRLYPIAQVQGAAQADIAYTSFEANGTGNWTIPDTIRNRAAAITGNISYSLANGNISKTGLAGTTTYIVSYWSTGGSMTVNGSSGTAGTVVNTPSGTTWTYYEHKISGATTVTVSGSGTIDELRLFPLGSLMTTYTYTPLVGMTTTCTPGNYITYYTYDGLGRLVNVKDLRGNIIKTYNYHYAGQ
jgi:hypothetical protein